VLASRMRTAPPPEPPLFAQKLEWVQQRGARRVCLGLSCAHVQIDVACALALAKLVMERAMCGTGGGHSVKNTQVCVKQSTLIRSYGGHSPCPACSTQSPWSHAGDQPTHAPHSKLTRARKTPPLSTDAARVGFSRGWARMQQEERGLH